MLLDSLIASKALYYCTAGGMKLETFGLKYSGNSLNVSLALKIKASVNY